MARSRPGIASSSLTSISVAVGGLTHTRQRVVERLLAVPSQALLTPQLFDLSARRLKELPSAIGTRIEFVPRSGVAELRAHVVERPLIPSDPWSYAALGLVAAARKEVSLSTGALTRWRRADQCGLAILAGPATRERRDRRHPRAGAGCGASMDSRSGNPSPTTRFRRLAEAVVAPAYRTGLRRGREYRRAWVSTPGRIVGSTASHQPVFDSRQRTIA